MPQLRPRADVAFCYAVGWTQHTVGVQYIRTAAIIQTLLGNMGRPGGGIMALRGHASIQGSTDIPTLYNLLPGLPAHAQGEARHRISRHYMELNKSPSGWWSEFPKYLVSLLKAWYRRCRDGGKRLVLRLPAALTGDHSHMTTCRRHGRRRRQGILRHGREPRGRDP